MMGDKKRDDIGAIGSAPGTPVPGEDADALLEACDEDRASLTPRQTADCAGVEIAEAYENEEDGGS